MIFCNKGIDSLEVVKPDDTVIGLIKAILEQNRIILLTNESLIKYLSAPPVYLISNKKEDSNAKAFD